MDDAHRGRGIGRVLVEAGERWAREQGCSEFGSDVEIENEVSRRAHERLGFREVAVVRCLLKRIVPG